VSRFKSESRRPSARRCLLDRGPVLFLWHHARKAIAATSRSRSVASAGGFGGGGSMFLWRRDTTDAAVSVTSSETRRTSTTEVSTP
jgi:hypothetical protein